VRNQAGALFLLDANVYIEARNRYYPFDICPGFWEALALNRLRSIDRVKDELEDDELNEWARNKMPAECFAKTGDPDVIAAFSQVMQWVQLQHYTDGAKAAFASVADGWLIAYAMVHGRVLVTHEQPAPNSKTKIKIPDICRKFGVQYVDTFEMLRALPVRFVLEDQQAS
jgi:hypothetical protein